MRAFQVLLRGKRQSGSRYSTYKKTAVLARFSTVTERGVT